MSRVLLGLFICLIPQLAVADSLNSGDGAWLLTSTALVLFMTLPGLALFYAGLVRAKNVLSVLMQCFALTCLMSLLWMFAGYGLAFGDGGDWNAYIGSGQIMLSGVTRGSMSGTIPETVFVMFQMTFAIITPGSDRGRFRGKNEILCGADFQHAVVVCRLRPRVSLGVGWRLVE